MAEKKGKAVGSRGTLNDPPTNAWTSEANPKKGQKKPAVDSEARKPLPELMRKVFENPECGTSGVLLRLRKFLTGNFEKYVLLMNRLEREAAEAKRAAGPQVVDDLLTDEGQRKAVALVRDLLGVWAARRS